MMENLIEKILQECKKYGQQHLIDHYESLPQPLKVSFLKQLQAIDFQQVHQLYKNVYLQQSAKKNHPKTDEVNFEPVKNNFSLSDAQKHQKELNALGMEAIAQGKVAVIIMSGGQGTRLGFNHPKGMFKIGLQSGLSLFGFFAARLLRLMKCAKDLHKDSKKSQTGMIKWYLMTSEMNHNEIVQYFRGNDFFGYDKDSIVFFPQGGIPALSYDGKIIIQSEGKISLAPGGNGAIYTEMKKHGILQHMKNNGIEYIHIGPVDNLLLKIADPISLGYAIKHKLDIVSHSINKRSWEEKVGLHVVLDGKIKIMEYTEVPVHIKQLKKDNSEYIFRHGARATMYISWGFVDRLTADPKLVPSINAKYHLAEKKVKYYDSSKKETITPLENNGVKFQLFYFDIFEECQAFAIFETNRQDEFAPLKNANGEDSPQIAKLMLHQMHRKWLAKAGLKLSQSDLPQIHPRISYNGEGLKQYILEKLAIFIDK